MDYKKIKMQFDRNPYAAYPIFGLAGILGFSVLMMFVGPKAPEQKTSEKEKNKDHIGLSVGGVDQQATNVRLEKNYFDLQEQLSTIQEQIKKLIKDQKQLSLQYQRMADIAPKKGQDELPEPEQEDAQRNYELQIADFEHLGREAQRGVYLPMGSFCKGTLLTGVYAAADAHNPLPVLLRLDEAFYGPNQTRIPLKGAFVLGKAYGDINSSRAYIQIIALSSVLPDGVTFEREQNLGYVTDAHGELGVPGPIIRRTGKELALMFMSGFVSGAAQGMADTQVTTSRGSLGDVSQQVTGNNVHHAASSGLSKSASSLSSYYEKQAEEIIPAIHIKPGVDVYFIVQKGVRIDDLPVNHFNRLRHMD